MKILITQAAPLSERNPFSSITEHYDAQIDWNTLIRIEGLTVSEFREQRINPLDYTAVMLTSKLACDHYFSMMEALRLKVPENMHYYCISEAVSNYLTKFILYRKRKIFIAEKNNFLSLLSTLNRKTERVLLVVSDIHNDDIQNSLLSNGVQVTSAVMYRTVSDEWPKDKAFDYDIVAVNTPTAVRAIRQNFPDWKPGQTALICFGAGTQEAAEQFGWEITVKAPAPGVTSLAMALEQYLAQKK